MGYFIGLPSELDVVEGVVSRLTDDGYDRDELDTVSSQDIDVDIEVYAEENDDIDVLERGTEDGETYLVLEPKTDDARALLEGETPPALEAGDEGYDSTTEKSDDSTKGGEDTMTDDYELDELDSTEARHAGSLEHYENEDEYGDLESDELEALGTALYVEEIVSGERDDIEVSDVAEYIADQDEFDFEAFVGYKAEIGNQKDYDQFVGAVGEVVTRVGELTDELEARGAVFEALYGEVKNERENADEAISGIMDEVSDLDTESDWLDQAADLDAAQQQEQEAQERFEDLEDQAEELLDGLQDDSDEE